MGVGQSYKQHGIDGTYDVVVVGSGMGALAAASLLAREGGRRVLILERHYTVGGFTHVFRRRRFEWDVGVHYVGEWRPGQPGRAMFDRITDGALEWADMGPVYDRAVIGGDVYDFPAGREEFRSEMAGHFPRRVRSIDGYLALLDQAVASSRLFFAEKAVPPAVAIAAGGLMRWRALRFARRTTLDVLSGLTDDPRLIGVLTAQYGDYGLPPGRSSFLIHALVAKHYLGGAAYPVGGAGRIAATVVPAIERVGGAVRTCAEVAAIVVEGRRAVGVRLADGREVRAPIVISDAGARITFGRLLPSPLREHRALERRLAAIQPSVAHVCLHIGLDRSAGQLRLPTHNVWVFPDHHHDRNVNRYMRDPGAAFPVVFISAPSAKDPDFERRYPGRSTIEAITPVSWRWFEPWKVAPRKRRDEAYTALKKDLTDRLLAMVIRELPQIEGHVEHVEISTPLSTRHFTGHPTGEMYGLAHSPERFEARWLKPRTPVPGLFLTGADVVSVGVTGAMMGGALTASAILNRNLMS